MTGSLVNSNGLPSEDQAMWSVLFPGFVLVLATITCLSIWLIDGLSKSEPASNDDRNGPHDPFF